LDCALRKGVRIAGALRFCAEPTFYNPSMSAPPPNLLSYDEAAALIAAHAAALRAHPPAVARIPLLDARDRALAQPIVADRDQPPFARSTRDGYACRAAEASRHHPLPVAGASRAGDPPSGPLPTGSAWEIMTGAPVPAEADAVMMLEHVEAVEAAAQRAVRLLPPRTLDPGENVVSRGAQARAGEELLTAGAVIGAGQIALAASCGYAQLDVYARPRVAILATGDELVSVESEPAPGQIRNSNSPMLAALVAAAGAEPQILPVAADNAEALDAAIAQARNAALLLITGGVSAGKFDLVEPALARAGAVFHFTGVKIQPGKPTVFGEFKAPNQNQHGTKFLGLPGNPVSSAVTFQLFASPILAALADRRDLGPRFALARLMADVKAKPGLTRFLPASCTYTQDPQVQLVPSQGSGDLAALARANCFLVVPESADHLPAGSTVHILLP
jgi:molybdopterin molybdotransferase